MPGRTHEKPDAARAFLESVREARFNMDRASRELRKEEARCEQITAQLSGDHGGNGDPHKDGAWAVLADRRTQLEECYAEAERRAVAVEEFVKQIPAANHRILLRLRYIDLLHWPEVRKRLGDYKLYYSERQIFRLHGDALEAARKLWAEIYDGKGDGA